MCRLGCVSARLETSQHLPWICCDQNCCFPASRQLSELPWGGAGIAVGVLGGSFGHCWGCAGCPCCFQLLGVMSVLDLSGSWWPCMVSSCVAREHFPLCCLRFRPGALRFPPHGEQQCGVCSGEQWGGGGGELCPLQGICSPKCREFWAFLAASLHAVHQGQVLTETLNARGNTGSSCLTASVTQTGPFHSAL